MTEKLERPLMGVRTFRSTQRAEEGLLAGISEWRDYFEPDKPKRAECRAGGAHEPDHSPPDPNCRCGWYAWYSPESTIGGELSTGIMGVVSAWGDVELHERGFRAEYVQIEALVTRYPYTSRLIGGMADKYAVPLIAESEVDDFCRERGEVLEPSEPAVDPAALFVHMQVRISDSFRQLAEDLKPLIEQMNRVGQPDNRAANRKPANFQEAIERKRNKPAFWREAAGGDIHA